MFEAFSIIEPAGLWAGGHANAGFRTVGEALGVCFGTISDKMKAGNGPNVAGRVETAAKRPCVWNICAHSTCE